MTAIQQVTNAEYGSQMAISKVKDGRTTKQNALAHVWYSDAAMQGDMTVDEYKAYCKLHFGIPIRRRDDDYREMYDKSFKRMPYHIKIHCMREAFDLPVTREFTVEEYTEYLDVIHLHFSSIGIRLTDPSTRGMQDWREWQ